MTENAQDRLNYRLHKDMHGTVYICVQVDIIKNLAQRASALYNMPTEVVDMRGSQTCVIKWCARQMTILTGFGNLNISLK